MDIVKRLSLNKTPKSVENNSIVAAKNIMVDNTGSFITNEPGFGVAFECPNENEYIVGCIPCAKEIVIFTFDNVSQISRIYRYTENVGYSQVHSSWNYNGGKLIGAYTYNYKKELIIAVSEYDAVDDNNQPILVPLKSWNLDTESMVVSDYATESEINPFSVKYIIGDTGYLLAGAYTFFIRFKISENAFTKWFQITDDIIITNIINKEKTQHNYLNANNTTVNTTVLSFLDSQKFEVNGNNLSSSSIILNLDFQDNTLYDEYQIGYIFKRNSDSVARLKSTYPVSITSIEINNNEYIEELLIDDMLEAPHQFYNVKSLINYNNRLYIGNYSEYKNENLQEYADAINVKFIHKERSEEEEIDTEVTSHQIDISSDTVHQLAYVNIYTDNNKTYISNPKQFIEKTLAKNIKTPDYYPSGGEILNRQTDVTANYTFNKTFVQPFRRYRLHVTKALYLLFIYNGEHRRICLYNSGGTSADYKLELVTVNDTKKLYLVYTESGTEYSIPLNTEPVIVDGKTKYTPLINVYTSIVGTMQTLSQSIDIHTGYWLDFEGGYTPTKGVPINTSYIYNETTIISKSNNVYNSNRTLIPNQVYALYVHYIRKDFSYTDGFSLTAKTEPNTNYDVVTNSANLKLFKPTRAIQQGKPLLIFPEFSNISYPEGYIGCFISYEAVEKSAINTNVIRAQSNSVSSEQPSLKEIIDVTNSNFIFGDDSIFGNNIYDLTNNTNIPAATVNTVKKEEVNNQLSEAYVELQVIGVGAPSSPNVGHIVQFLLDSTSIYTKSSKVLYRLTNNIFSDKYEFGTSEDPQTFDDPIYEHLPGYCNEEKIIYYKDANTDTFGAPLPKLIMSPDASNVINGEGQKIDSYNVELHTPLSYSEVPVNAYSVLQDYANGAVSLIDNEGHPKGVYYNKILSPDKLKTFLELKECYKAKPLKAYTNYSKDHSDTFGKTIYRSNVISDESLVNGFREFVSTNYKNIIENKGEITNIIGIGLYLIVHTEYSMFVFDRSPKLTQRSQLDIPDAFEIDYQEVMPSNEGFGGLANREESILTKHGYIWFDKVNKYIFTYENGSAKIISQDIHNFIKNLNILTVRFAEDIVNNRLLICLYIITNDGEENQLTISYSFITKTFISLHDYTFSDNFRTYESSYLFDKNKDNKRLYSFNKYSKTYQLLTNVNSVFYPTYAELVQHTKEFNFDLVDEWTDDSSSVVEDNSGSEELTENNSEQDRVYIVNELKVKNYIDIIFNVEYNLPKVLNCISYILSEISSEYDAVNVSEEYLNRRFSGNSIEIYSDECYTGLLDITQKEIVNKLEEIKLPYWHNGCWNLNYFRNKITTPVTGEELAALSEIPYYNKNTGTTELAHVNLDKLKSANLYDATTNKAAPSDNRSLISGKYFVVRFIFNNDKNFKLDELSFNVNKY